MSKLRTAIFSLVRRPGAEDHLLLTLLVFALSVTLTRLLLLLTGYPQLSGAGLHIAHVVWGGLLLFIAALLPLIFANQWIYRLTAVLAGLGVGLFIDEVGKFISSTNDYFFQPAAPIIYAFFLVCVLVYLQVSRPPHRQARVELYAALEYLEQVLERDLDPHELRQLVDHLGAAAGQDEQPELAQLARVLLGFVISDWVSVVPPSPNRLDDLRLKLHALQSRIYGKTKILFAVIAGLFILGVTCLGAAVWIILAFLEPAWSRSNILFGLKAGDPITIWYMILSFFLAISGLGLTTGGVLIWKHRSQIITLPPSGSSAERQVARGLRWSYFSLMLQLTILDLLIFYYFQFGTLLLVAVQFTMLLAVIHYQRAT